MLRLGYREILERKGPIREFLSKRPTLILPKPLISLLGLNPNPEKVRIDRLITYDEAVAVVSRTPWAVNLARGMAEAGGLKPDTPEYRAFVERFSRRVAEGLVRGMA